MAAIRGPRLVGRTEEIAALRAAATSSRRGTPTVVLLEGEPGIGKSRLLREAIGLLAGPDDALMLGHGVDLAGGELPFGMVADALRDLVRREGQPSLRAAAPRALGTLAGLVSELGEGTASSHSRGEIFDAFVSLIETLGTDRLVWLVGEDLHWADTSSRDLLSYLVRVVGPSRLLVTATLRTGAGAGDVSWLHYVTELARNQAVQRIQLERLSKGDVEEQLAALLRRPADAALLDRVVDLAQGIPFLTEELILGGLQSTGPVPSSALDLMVERVAGLSASATTVVRASSVASGHLWHRLLSNVCQLDEHVMATACAEAIASQVLEIDDTGIAYRFRHTLLREAVLASLPPADRLHWHARWAHELQVDQSSPDKDLGQIAAAYHWECTGDADRAFSSTLDAIDMAGSLGATTERAALMRRLLRLWSGVPDAAHRAGRTRDAVLDETIDAMVQADDWAAALAVIDDELSSRHETDSDRRISLRVRRRWFVQQLGAADDIDQAELRSLLARLLSSAPSPLVVEALTRLGFDLVATSPGLAERAHARAVDVADQLGEPRKRFWARSAMAMHLALVGRHEDAISMATDLIRPVRSRFPAEASVLEAECTWWLCCLGRYVEAHEMGTRALNLVGRPAQARRNWAVATAHLSAALISMGRWHQAGARLEEARQLRVAGSRGAVLDALAGVLACYRGDLRTAAEAARASRAKLPAREELAWPTFRGWVRWLAAEIAAAEDDADEMRRQVAVLWEMPGLEIASDVLWEPLLLAARVEADLASYALGRRGGGRPVDRATDPEAHLGRLREVAARLHSRGPLGAAWTAQFEAECDRFVGAADPVPWTAVADLWERVGRPHDRAWALLRIAECQLVSGRRHAAVSSLREAGALADRLGALPLLRAVAGVVRLGRLDLGEVPTPGSRGARPLALTVREIEVLTLVAAGKSNDEIARELFISPKTASVHVSHILGKLDVHTRTEAADRAHRLHLL